MAEVQVYLQPLYEPTDDKDWVVGWQAAVWMSAPDPLWESDLFWRTQEVFIDG